MTKKEAIKFFEDNCKILGDEKFTQAAKWAIVALKNSRSIRIGDVVKTTKDKNPENNSVFPIGTIGVITEIHLNSVVPYKVKTNDDYWFYSEDMFEVIVKGINHES